MSRVCTVSPISLSEPPLWYPWNYTAGPFYPTCTNVEGAWYLGMTHRLLLACFPHSHAQVACLAGPHSRSASPCSGPTADSWL